MMGKYLPTCHSHEIMEISPKPRLGFVCPFTDYIQTRIQINSSVHPCSKDYSPGVCKVALLCLYIQKDATIFLRVALPEVLIQKI